MHLKTCLYCNTSWAKQRWHAGKWLPDQEEGGSRILFKEARESDQYCVAAPRNTSLYTTRNTTRYTTRNTTELLAGAAFWIWSFEAFKEWNENTSQFSVLTGNAAPGSVSAVLRVV